MGAPRGNKNGRLFSKSRQPGKRVGRKSSLINEFIKAFNLEDESRQISREDANKLLSHILSCNKTEFESMARNIDLPVSIVCQMVAIAEDMKNKKCDNVNKIWDRLYGKAPMMIELAGASGTPLIPDIPMSRVALQELLKTIQQNGITRVI